MGDNVVDRVWKRIERRYTDDSDGCECGSQIEEPQSTSPAAAAGTDGTREEGRGDD